MALSSTTAVRPCAGCATAARAAGHDPLEITRAGGWVDGSHVLARYMNDVDRVKNSPLLGIGL
ncbi:hypothetical protein AB0J81_12300 [Streptomyces bobili]|uniref:hypothetical protein n=1 Tax=Streptomyces bobili TaxID=67280 RepID=UPI0033F68ADE